MERNDARLERAATGLPTAADGILSLQGQFLMTFLDSEVVLREDTVSGDV